MKIPKILFRVDANSKIGWGHFYRSLSLALMLKSRFKIIFAISAPDDQMCQVLSENDISYITLPLQEYSTPDERGENELIFDLSHYLEDVKIVVLDGYWFGSLYQNALQKYAVKIAVIEDEGGGDVWADLIINHAPGLSEENYNFKKNNQPIFALGPDHALLRPEFLCEANKKASHKHHISSVLICFGGVDLYNLTFRACRLFLENTNYHIHTIVGKSYVNHQSLEELAKMFGQRVSISSNLNAKEMLTAMKNADLGIVPCSGILYECIACRLPLVSGFYIENQQSIYNGWCSKGVFIDAGDFRKIDWEKILPLVQNLDPMNLVKQQVKYLDGYSGKRLMRCFEILAA